MPRWWSGGPGNAATPAELLAEADALYQQAAVELPQRGLHTMALRAAADAADRYRRALKAMPDPASRWPVKRRLSLALWRQSMLLNMLGRPKDAMKPGREGLALGRELLATLPPGSPGSDELVGEVATAMNDLRQAAIAGRFADEIGDLQQEVVALCEANPGPRARQALGTALHNEAAVMAGIAYQALAQGIGADPTAVARLTSLMDRAVGIRQGLADPARPMTLWELANSLLLRRKVSCLLGVRVQPALEDLVSAWRIAKQLEGPSAESLRRDLDQAMAVVERAYPTVVATVRWPSRFRGPS